MADHEEFDDFEKEALAYLRQENEARKQQNAELTRSDIKANNATDIWSEFDMVDISDIDINAEINDCDISEVPQKISSSAPPQRIPTNTNNVVNINAKKKNSFSSQFAKYAVAASVIGMAISIPAYYGIPKTVEVPTGGHESVRLTDGSTITLESGSVATISEGWGRREVVLEDGVAFFQVSKNPDKPFYVNSGGTKVTVLGTAFSVYRKQKYVEVVVESGKVNVASKESTSGTDYDVDLVKNEKITVSHAGTASPKETIDIDKELSWRNGRIDFRNASLEYVVTRLGDYYQAPIKIMNKSLRQRKITSTVYLTNIDAFFDALSIALNIKVERNDEGGVLIY